MKSKELLINFPESLRSKKQWVMWKMVKIVDKKTGADRYTKVPFQVNGRNAAVDNPNTWSTFQACYEAADKWDGVGFVFTDGIIGIDLDKCFEYDGTLKDFAQDILLSFDSYTERSPSGNGLHIIIESNI